MPRSDGTLPLPQHRRKHNGISLVPPPSKKTSVQRAEIKAEEQVAPSPGLLKVWWPAIFGILLAVIAPQILAKGIDVWGNVAERLIFPFVILAGRPEFGFGAELTRNLPQLVLYLTFPFFGFYASWNLRRRIRLSTTIVQIVFVNLISAFVLWLLSRPGASHGM
jgi:hypothetical protein